jgi:undecaprenyl-diphosphatase
VRTSEALPVEIDGRLVPVWMAFIGNCRYLPAGFTPSWRDRLDDGIIDIRYVDASRPFARIRLVLSALTGTLDRSSVYRCVHATDEIEIVSTTGPLRLARDGETFSATGPSFTIEKSPQRLSVIVPPASSS